MWPYMELNGDEGGIHIHSATARYSHTQMDCPVKGITMISIENELTRVSAFFKIRRQEKMRETLDEGVSTSATHLSTSDGVNMMRGDRQKHVFERGYNRAQIGLRMGVQGVF